MGAGMTPRQWWRRAAAAAKDKRSLCLARLGPLSPRHCRGGGGGGGAPKLRRHPELEAAVIKATSHDESRMDYKNAGRVFAWARTSPATFLRPVMWALSRRVEKTHSWAVALKALMVAHGVVLCCGAASAAVGRLPFDLSAFRDRSSCGLSAFVRAYFNFLDLRSLFLTNDAREEGEEVAPAEEALTRVERMQDLLELLMQVRPYGNEGARARLLLEAMDCVVVEIFEVYSAVCSGIACSLVAIFGSCASAPSSSRSSSSSSSSSTSSRLRSCIKDGGTMGIRVLRRAAEQSSQLSSYFDLCRGLGVLNAAELPPVERIPEEDIKDLEALLLLACGSIPGTEEREDGHGPARGGGGGDCGGGGGEVVVAKEEKGKRNRLGTVVTENWEVFEDELAAAGQAGRSCSAAPVSAAAAACSGCSEPLIVGSNNGLWELMMYHQPGPKLGCGSSVALTRQCGPESLVPWKTGSSLI